MRSLLCWHHSRGSLDEGCPGCRKRLKEAGMGPRDVRLGCREVPTRPQRVSCPRGHEFRAAADVQAQGPLSVPDHQGRRLFLVITVDAGVTGWCASTGASSGRAISARPASSATRRRARGSKEGDIQASRHLMEGRDKPGDRGRWVANMDCKRRHGLQENASVHCCYQDVLPVLHRARTGACSAC